MNQKSESIDLDDIVLDERCQLRRVLTQEAVDEYAELYTDETDLPPLEVVDVDGDKLLIDGFHRLAAARQIGAGFVRVVVVEEADIDRAVWLAAAANQGHGVRRSNEDKRNAVRMALGSATGQEQSTRVLAEHLGVSHMLVSKMRKEEEERENTPGVNGLQQETEDSETKPEAPGEDDDKPEQDMYHTASKRILTCYKKVLKILGENDVVCEALYIAYEKAQEREL